MTAAIRRFSSVTFFAVLLAIAMVPGIAFAHDAIPGTTGSGSQDDPVVISDTSTYKSWTQFKAALELEENLYIKVENTIGNGTFPALDASFKAGDPLITIPKGYAKDVELMSTGGVLFTRHMADNQVDGDYVPFGCMILNQGTLIVHSEVNSTISGKSSYSNYSIIRNEGTLYFYGKAGVSASFTSDQDKYGAKYGRGIHCTSDDAVLVISGKGTFTGRSKAQYKANDVAAGVFVQKAKSVDIFGGSFRNGGDSMWYKAGLAVSGELDSDVVKIHGGELQGFVVVDVDDVYSVTFESYLGTQATFNDEFTDSMPSFVSRDYENDIVEFRTTKSGASTFEIEAGDPWWTMTDRNYEGVHIDEFTAGDGVTYQTTFTGIAKAIDYNSDDPTVTMASTPVWPVDGQPCDIVRIGDRAFAGTAITEVVMPDTGKLDEIGERAFADTNLKEVAIPESVHFIEESAFANSKLEKVFLVGYDSKTIGENAFGSPHLKEISCASMVDMNIAEHAYGYYLDGESDKYVRNDPVYVYAMPGSPFWEDAVKKGFIADLRAATVKAIPDQPYFGSAVEPKPVVTVKNDLGTVTLKEGKDYTLTYEKNTALGTATVHIVAIDPPNYGAKAVDFKIVEPTMADATVSAIPAKTYTGKEIRPVPTVKIGGTTLKEGTDFTVSYKDNVNVGTAAVTLEGVGAVSGTKTVQFTIKKASLADTTVTNVVDKSYEGNPVVQNPTVVLGDVLLQEGVDYDATYKDNVKVGTATMTLTGKGNLTGTKSLTFKIKKGSMANATVTGLNDYPYTGAPIEQGPTVYLGAAPLVEGIDYKLSYKDNVEVGTATVIITGIGNVAGTKSATFKILDPDGGVTWSHLAGDNALATMAKIVEVGDFPVGGTVVLASLEGYWDALTAAGIAGLENAPVLMVLQDSLPEQTADLLKKLAPKKIIVCGGTYWLPDEVIMLAQAAAGTYPDVVRLAGSNAAQTAEKIAAKGKGKWSDTAIVATAGTFQDALAAAPLAYAKKMPIFLAQFDFAAEKGYIDADTVKAMKDAGIKKCYIAGGTYWLPQSVTDDLKAAGITVVKQLGGATAVETSGLIAQLGIDEFGLVAEDMGVADVRAHYDALASAALCGKNGSVLVLTLDENSSVIGGFVKTHRPEMTGAYIFGGTNSVSAATQAALKAATK